MLEAYQILWTSLWGEICSIGMKYIYLFHGLTCVIKLKCDILLFRQDVLFLKEHNKIIFPKSQYIWEQDKEECSWDSGLVEI